MALPACLAAWEACLIYKPLPLPACPHKLAHQPTVCVCYGFCCLHPSPPSFEVSGLGLLGQQDLVSPLKLEALQSHYNTISSVFISMVASL